MSPEMINGCLALQPLCISPSHSCKLVVTSFRVPVLSLTSSSDLMALSFIISWKRSKLLVPIGCSSNSLHRATSWGRSRCSSVSSSSNSLENRTMSFVWGCSPVPRTWNGKLRTHYFSKASSVRPQTRDSGSVTTLNAKQFAVIHLLNIFGEALRLIVRLCFIPSSHLSDRLLQKLSQLQLRSQTFFLLLLLQDDDNCLKMQCNKQRG